MNSLISPPASRALKHQTSESLLGRLRPGGVPAILQYLATVALSGELLVLSGVHRAVIALQRGCIVDARFDNVDGEQALYRAMQLEVGCFAFDDARHSKIATVDGSLDGLLMQAAYWQDTTRARDSISPNGRLRRIGPPIHARNFSSLQLRILEILEEYPDALSIAHRLIQPLEVITQEITKLVAAGVLAVTDPGREVNPRFIKEMRDHLKTVIGPQAYNALTRATQVVGPVNGLNESQLAHFLDELGRDLNLLQQLSFLLHARRIARGYDLI